MRRIAFLLVLVSLSLPAEAQWKKIADFIGTDGSLFTGSEYITCVYFLDLPGPPTIGFVGTQSDLYKTTNGGKTWRSVWDSNWSFSEYYVTDICFKDSLTGWFSIVNNGGITGDECYRTIDGGETWNELSVPGVYYSEGRGLYYSDSSRRLFLISAPIVRISTDLGDTWPDSLSYYAVYPFSFSTPLNGILSVTFIPDTTQGFIITSDGGVTWDTIHPQIPQNGYTGGVAGILAIPGTQTCFSASLGADNKIRRSDDFGRNWRIVADFSHTVDSFAGCTGFIRGDFSRLTIQTDKGMYVSVDSGVTWNYDGGPPYDAHFSNDEFYSANGVTIAGKTYGDGVELGGGLWEEIWPTSGVAEHVDTASDFRVFPNPAGSSITIEGASGSVAVYDPLGRSCTTPQPPPWKGGGVVLDVSGLPSGIYFIGDGVSRAKFVKE